MADLRDIDYFATIPIGIESRTTEGEKDYKLILSEPPQRSLELFEELYAKGNVQAKAYALVGIHRLSPAKFKELYPALGAFQDKVATERGCIVMDESLQDVAKQIEIADYW